MKRVLPLLLTLLLAAPALGQIKSSQISLKTGGGLGGDSALALGVEVYRSATAPASPETGMPWCDTNTAPCTLKLYDGDSWEVVAPAANITTQADAGTLPGTPSDGQLVYMRSCRCLWIYDSTNAWWVRLDSNKATAGADITETFGGTVITAPASAPTVTATSGGSATAGTHVCAVTYANSTGGETTGSASSASVTIGSPNFTYSFSSVPTGGSGTTARRLYCSKAGATTPLYWVATIGDNTTTSTTSTLADASFRYRMPEVNFSAALPTDWAVDNWDSSGTDSGGCGSTGSSVWCQTPRLAAYAATGAADTCVRLRRDITTYAAQAFEIRWRGVAASDYVGGANSGYTQPVTFGGVRNGDAASAVMESIGTTTTAPIGTGSHAQFGRSYRTTGGGSRTAYSATSIAGPPSAYPFYFVYQHTGATYYRTAQFIGIHADGPFAGPALANATDALYGFGVFSSGVTPTRFDLCMTSGSSGAAVEIDSWSLTQR